MTLLDTVMQMHEQGINDVEIAQRLREQGVNAKEIDEAINQSKIKSAVENNEGAMTQQTGMQQSVMEQSQGQEQIQEQVQVQQQYYPQQEQQYPQYEYYQPQQQGISSDTVTEIAEQIISEKFLKIKKQLDAILESKLIAESKTSGMDERLKKIEVIIEKLQISILEKVGSYGSDIQDIKGEMEMMQDSFSKALNPIVDRARKQEVPEQKSRKKEVKTQQNKVIEKDSDGFENYLR
jgi:hypothetical protein